MAIERNCKNCAKESGCPECDCNKGNNYEEFAPKEELVRQDELDKKIEIENDVEIALQKGTYSIEQILMIIKIANNSSRIMKKYDEEE